MSDVQIGFRVTSAAGTGTLTVGLPFDGESSIIEAARRLKLAGKVDRLVARMKQFAPGAMTAELQARLVGIEADLIGADADVRRAQKALDSAEDALTAARAKRGESESSTLRERSRDAVAQAVYEAGRAVESARVPLQRANAFRHRIATQRDDIMERLADIDAAGVYQRLRPRLDAARDALATVEESFARAKATWLAEAKAGDDTASTDGHIGQLVAAVAEARDRVSTLDSECVRSRHAMQRAGEGCSQHTLREAAADFDKQIEDRKADLVKLALPLALEVIALEQAKTALHEQATRLRYDDE